MNVESVQKAKSFVKKILEQDVSGHDWSHIERVWDMANRLVDDYDGVEPIDRTVVALSALLHDVPDWKLTDDVEGRYAQIAAVLSEMPEVSDEQVDHVMDILKTMSWHTGETMKTNEGKIVQDADRLDALGAIGIARTFAYGGVKGRAIYNPNDLMTPVNLKGQDDYKKSARSSIAHFYDKLLHLSEKMHTPRAREIAIARTRFLKQFLDEFFREWNLLD